MKRVKKVERIEQMRKINRENYQRNKLDLMIKESSGFKIDVYYHTIYWCQQGLMILRSNISLSYRF